MALRDFAIAVLTVAVCGTLTGCHIEYQATVKCVRCDDPSLTIESTGDFSCTVDGAVKSAGDKCPVFHVPGAAEITDERLVPNFQGCPDEQDASLLSEGLRYVVAKVGQRAGIKGFNEAIEATNEPSCPPRMIDVKVTVFQDVPVPECPGDIVVEISYFKRISEGVHEYITLSATVPVGGSHEFICMDAEVAESGNVGTIRVAALADVNCIGETVLATANSYSTIPADGSSLECHADLNANQLTAEIIPPSNAVPAETAPSSAQQILIPIPDPRFTRSSSNDRKAVRLAR